MSRVIRTQCQIQALKPKAKKYAVRTEIKGLSILVYASGVRVFRFQKKVVGQCALMTLAQAIRWVKQQSQPAATAPKPKKRRSPTPKTPATNQLMDQLFKNLMDAFLVSHTFADCPRKNENKRKRSHSMVRNSLYDTLATVPVSQITPDLLEKTFIDLVKQGKRDGAGRCRAVLKDFYKHLLARQIVKKDATEILDKMVFTGPNAMEV